MTILITGGSASGKSEFAEEKLCSLCSAGRVYLATMIPYDEESRQRISRHRKLREGKAFRTIERARDLAGIEYDLMEEDSVLLECVSNLVANEMFNTRSEAGLQGINGSWPVEERIRQDICRMSGHVKNLVIVTNEVFSESGSYGKETEEYLRILGNINCFLAKMADEVYEVVYGIPVLQKKQIQK